MIALQPFKENDVLEGKVTNAFLTPLVTRDTELDAFFNGAFTCFALGDVLFTLSRDPLAGVISQNVYRKSFFAIHNLFTRPGTFEFYMEVFKAVWGDDVVVEFTIPGPGKLLISVEAVNVTLDNFMARKIVSGAYVYEEVIDEDGDNIVFQGIQGLKTQAEADALLNELYPAGIWIGISVDIIPPPAPVLGSYFLSEDGFTLMTEDGDSLTLED